MQRFLLKTINNQKIRENNIQRLQKFKQDKVTQHTFKQIKARENLERVAREKEKWRENIIKKHDYNQLNT